MAVLVFQESAIAAPHIGNPFAVIPSFFTNSLAQSYGSPLSDLGGIKESGQTKIISIDSTATLGQNFSVCWIGSKNDELVLGDVYVLSPISFFYEDGKMCAWFSLFTNAGVSVPPGTYEAKMLTPSGNSGLGGTIIVN
ncbi:MAG: hypothetical protein WEC37_02855 [Anaerolineales bacterium]